ncbi:hypothetical protein P6U16_08325 [Rhizobium sp. 32-5/1]|uniref:hypothetical protein n=1 Tax=Rhizobium sp. 32-5/1 TaxID=3019602 RepID=UPI00240E597A|nr:hypothetical protein [Rhizobium sp. 32-5/1]WEZ84565.1 hypothetical protein P6U16_08325 [Rhizobium sp. 32-5/1]
MVEKKIEPTERQRALLEAEDWRYFAIDYVGTGLGSIATTEKVSLSVGRIVSFGLPSAPALFLDLAAAAHRRRTAIDLNKEFVVHTAPQGVFPENQTGLFDFLQEMSAEIVMSFSAIEAFANEAIPKDFPFSVTKRDGSTELLSGVDLQRQVSLDEKIAVVLPSALGIKSPRGKRPWENYRKLKAIRDRLVHLKMIDRKASGPEDQTIWGSLIENRNQNFALVALSIIGVFSEALQNRRWYKLADGAVTRP